MNDHLGDILKMLDALPEEERAALIDQSNNIAAGKKFIPNPGPQTEAYFSEADVLLYGGQAGGGKTGLICGLALEEHTNSLIMRRKFTDLQGGGGLIDELLKMYGSRKGFNGASPPTLRTNNDKVITFGGANMPGDEMAFAGRARDFLGLDEVTQFTKLQVETLMGWVRTTKEGQRTRTVFASNPPLTTSGDFVTFMFAPWLDPAHPRPAEPGELRYYVKNDEGEDVEVDGPEPVKLEGRVLIPQSRTFIPASTADNPYIDPSYRATLDNLPPSLRSALRDGNFTAMRQDVENQIIPSSWVQAAFDRWTPKKPDAPMCALAADVSGDGPDKNVIATRYDEWFAPLKTFKTKEAPTGADKAAKIILIRRNGATVVLDMGGGYGTSTYEALQELGVQVIKFSGSKKSLKKDKSRLLSFNNTRTAAYWMFREALDPDREDGSRVAMEFDQELLAELTVVTFEVKNNVIYALTKEKVKEILGRSPDKADATVMAWFAGPKFKTHGERWKGANVKSAVNGPTIDKGRSSVRRNLRNK